MLAGHGSGHITRLRITEAAIKESARMNNPNTMDNPMKSPLGPDLSIASAHALTASMAMLCFPTTAPVLGQITAQTCFGQ